MPVLIKVGVSRKLSKDFNSTGYTLDITSELPVGAAQDPNTMAQASDELFRLAEDLITAQVQKNHASPSPAYAQSASRPAIGQAGNGNGSARATVPGITDAQARAIESIARQLNEQPDRLSQDEFGLNVLNLSVRQASDLIDLLKRQVQASETPGGHR